MSAYFFGWNYTINKQKNCVTTSESKGRFFLQNESIRITNRIDSNSELECSADTPNDVNLRNHKREYCAALDRHEVLFIYSMFIISVMWKKLIDSIL